LSKANFKCTYCDGIADVIDHVIPRSFRLDDSEENLVAACRQCNGILGHKIFDSLEDKVEYVRDVMEGRSVRKWLVYGKTVLRRTFDNMVAGFSLEKESPTNHENGT